jgi:hypothetical protein
MQETQHKYVSRQYDLFLDNDFLIKEDADFMNRALKLND